MTGQAKFRPVVDALIRSTNAFDVEAVLALFSSDAVIDDPSTGACFEGHEGIRDYVIHYFKGYHTVTRLIGIELLGRKRARVRVDFTGDFGHEIGRLDLTIDGDGMILRIDADLE